MRSEEPESQGPMALAGDHGVPEEKAMRRLQNAYLTCISRGVLG